MSSRAKGSCKLCVGLLLHFFQRHPRHVRIWTDGGSLHSSSSRHIAFWIANAIKFEQRSTDRRAFSRRQPAEYAANVFTGSVGNPGEHETKLSTTLNKIAKRCLLFVGSLHSQTSSAINNSGSIHKVRGIIISLFFSHVLFRK